jgi:hypothetical protein
MSKVASGIVTLFPLSSEVGANLIGHVLWEHVQWINGDIPETENPHSCLLLDSSIHLYRMTRLLLPLTGRGFFITPIRGSQVSLISTALFNVGVVIRVRIEWVIYK